MSTTKKIEKIQKKLTWITTALAEALTALGEISVEQALAEAAVDVAVAARKARAKKPDDEKEALDQFVYQAICDKDVDVARAYIMSVPGLPAGDVTASLGRLKAAGRITMTGTKRGARYAANGDTERPAAPSDGIEKLTEPAKTDPFDASIAAE